MADIVFTVSSAGAPDNSPVIGEIDASGDLTGPLALGFIPSKIVIHRKDSDTVSTVSTGLLLADGSYASYLEATSGARAWADAAVLFTSFAGDKDSSRGVNVAAGVGLDSADDLIVFEAYH